MMLNLSESYKGKFLSRIMGQRLFRKKHPHCQAVFFPEFPQFLVTPVVYERLVPPRRDGDPSLHSVQGKLSAESKGPSPNKVKETTWFVTLSEVKSLSKHGGKEIGVRSRCSIASLVQIVWIALRTMSRGADIVQRFMITVVYFSMNV
jgi:hypothetical protein